MLTFLRLQISSLVASVADFLITILLTEILGVFYVVSTSIGAFSGGLVNFYLNRKWIFGLSGKNKLAHHAIKYLLIWAGSMVLNSFGVYLFTEYVHMKYIISNRKYDMTKNANL